MPSNKTAVMKEIDAQIAELEMKYAEYKSRGLKLNMTRGKPCDHSWIFQLK
jgi:hypothetical protein